MDDYGFDGVDQRVIAAEKRKAQKLRKSRWWQEKISAGICHYCGQKVPAAHLTMDHIVALSLGGKSTKGNIVASCKECNTRKKGSLFTDWPSGSDDPTDKNGES